MKRVWVTPVGARKQNLGIYTEEECKIQIGFLLGTLDAKDRCRIRGYDLQGRE